jgi:RsiW-degrading membrane proteinase PrsW (M82 family)
MNAQSAAEAAALLLGPIGFWAVFHYYKDRHEPEPMFNLLLVYVLGVAAGYLCPQAYAALGWFGLRHDAYELAATNPPGLLLYALTGIGLLEECVKFLPFWLVGMRLHAFDEPVDGIVYASFVALGFATAENVEYLAVMDGWAAVARAVATPIVHCLFSSIWGYACSRARMKGAPVLPAALVGLAIAAAAHGLYDFAAIWGSDWVSALPPAIVLLIWVWRTALIKRLHVERGHE